MEWPHKNTDTTGKPRTTETNQSIYLQAVEAAATTHPEAVEQFRKLVAASKKNWRSTYSKVVYEFVKIQASVSSKTCLAMCRAGLKAADETMVYKNGEETISLQKAMAAQSFVPETITIRGSKPVPEKFVFQLASPHGTDQKPVFVTGDDAVAQLEAWEKYGCMEPSAAKHAQATCVDDDLSVSDKTFCLLGVTSEMGPLHSLTRIPGAHVMGVARQGPKLEKVKEEFQANAPNNSMLQVIGANLLSEMAEIAKWVVETAPTDRKLVLLPLAYMDGEANVRVIVAMDQIIQYVYQHRPDIALAYWMSPTTVYTIPDEAVMDARDRYFATTMFSRIVSWASVGQWLQPSNTWEQKDCAKRYLFNGIVAAQGPNYALAKLMQQWRAIVASEDWNIQVAAPYAPWTRTESVTHNTTAAASLEGLSFIQPLLAFDVNTCSTLMAAIVLNQLRVDKRQIEHPLQLFWDGAVHSGTWRCAFSTESVLVPSVILGKTAGRIHRWPTASLASLPST